jgi:hypothetical protein
MSSTDVDGSGADDGPHAQPLPEELKEFGEQSADDIPEKQAPPQVTFPEGGLKAWLVAAGAALVMFGTFGYVNAFG